MKMTTPAAMRLATLQKASTRQVTDGRSGAIVERFELGWLFIDHSSHGGRRCRPVLDRMSVDTQRFTHEGARTRIRDDS